MDYSLDYSLPIEDRVCLTHEIVDDAPPKTFTPYELTKMADYIIDGLPKEEKKSKQILTENRMVTINKRETSYQGIVERLEGGEDNIYGMLSDLGKSTLLTPKISITAKDLEEIPGLQELRDDIKETEEACEKATGRKKYLLKKQLIEMRQQQYILKEGHRCPSRGQGSRRGLGLCKLELDENITMVNGEPVSDGIVSIFNPTHVSALLRNYLALKDEVYGKFNSDLWYLMLSLDDLIEKHLKKEEPFLYDLLWFKIYGYLNVDIKNQLLEKYGYTHSVEYLSSLWRNKIPKLLAEKAKEDYILWYYTYEEKGVWKKCSRCGEIKLAHNRWFSKNKSSKDGYYSICKECRNKK